MSAADLYELEIQLEDEAMGLGTRRYRSERMDWSDGERKRTPEAELPPGMELMRRYLDGLADAVREWVATASSGSAVEYASMVRWLEQFDADVVAFITAKRCINALAECLPLQRVSADIAQMLVDELDYARFQEEAPGMYRVVWNRIRKSTSAHYRRAVMANAMGAVDVERHALTNAERVRLGRVLVGLFEQVTGLLHVVHRKVARNRTPALVEPTDKALAWLEKAHARCELMSPMLMPMVVPPQEWTGPFGGAT